MWKNITRRTAAGICIATLLYSSGCILSPQEDPAPPVKPPVVFEDLTEKEDVITNMLLSHKERNIEEYAKLLLKHMPTATTGTTRRMTRGCPNSICAMTT